MAGIDQGWQRDYIGYGAHPPDPQWPAGARIAVNFNLNYECGGESNILDGDDSSEGMLNDIGFPPVPGKRNPLAESAFEYGSRVGVWRVLRIFEEFDVRMSIFGVATALERNPEATQAFVELSHEIVSHGYRWIDYHFVDEVEERIHIQQAITRIQRVTGVKPVGWMTGRPGPNTRRLLVEEGFTYHMDDYSDDEPFWDKSYEKPIVILPYTLDSNDMKMWTAPSLTPADWLEYAIDTFEWLYREGVGAPRMMSLGVHLRIIGRPGRIGYFEKFLDHVAAKPGVWITTRKNIADSWAAQNPA